MKKLFIIGLLFFTGCASAPKFNRVSIGMTKPEVIAELGDPDSLAAKDNVEYMSYGRERRVGVVRTIHEDYYVRLVGGRVDSYGKKGDFDSVKPPEQTVNVNKTERVVRDPAARE